jgi:hypothetical protein
VAWRWPGLACLARPASRRQPLADACRLLGRVSWIHEAAALGVRRSAVPTGYIGNGSDNHMRPAIRLAALILATGSEVGVAVEAAKILGERARVVSLPCLEFFDARTRPGASR